MASSSATAQARQHVQDAQTVYKTCVNEKLRIFVNGGKNGLSLDPRFEQDYSSTEDEWCLRWKKLMHETMKQHDFG